MRALLLAVVLSVPAYAAKLELEVGAGSSGPRFDGPALSGRVGLDLFDHLTPSVRLVSATPTHTDNSAWALLGELRLHTAGRFQLNAGVGLGLAHGLTIDGVVHRQSFRPYALVDVGGRLRLGSFFLGANLGASPFYDDRQVMLSFAWAGKE